MMPEIRRMAVVVIALLIPAATALAAPTVRELEKKALDYRKALKTGHVVVKSTYRVDRNAKPYEQIVRTYDQVFDGPKVRSIVAWKFPKGKNRKTRTVIDGGLFIHDWSEDFAVYVYPDDPNPLNINKQEAWDPRLLGLAFADLGMIYRQSIDRDDQIFSYTRDGQEPTVTADRVGSRDAWRVDCRREPSIQASLWIVPEFGHGPARIQLDITEGRRHRQTSLDVEYGAARAGGVWYPSRVTYRDVLDDQVLLDHVAEVEVAEFGVEIGPETFSYKGIDLPPGREVLIKPENRAMIWDGRELRQQVGRPVNRPDEARKSGSPWYLWAGAIASALGSAALVFRLIQPKSRPPAGYSAAIRS